MSSLTTRIPILIQLFCICMVNRSRFTEQEVAAHYQKVKALQTAVDTNSGWRFCGDGCVDIARAVKQG